MEPIIGVMVAMTGNALGGAGSGSLGKRTACGTAVGSIGTSAEFEAVTRSAKQQRCPGRGSRAEVLDYFGNCRFVEEWPGIS
jgi:hypothetical protein